MAFREIPFSDGSSNDTLTSSSNLRFETIDQKLYATFAYDPAVPDAWPVAPNNVADALDSLAVNFSTIYLPTFFERPGAQPSGTGNFTIGGYSASDESNGYFALASAGVIMGAALTIQTTGVANGDECIIVVDNVTTAATSAQVNTLDASLLQIFTFDFSPALDFSAGDQLNCGWQINTVGFPTYLNMSLMLKIRLDA